MIHVHSPKITRSILGNELYECSCGARKWSNGKVIKSENGTFRIEDGWYVYIPDEIKEVCSQIPMNIYKVWRIDDVGYDEYDSAIVVAENEEQARALCPFDASNPEIVKVEIVDKYIAGIVISSYISG